MHILKLFLSCLCLICTYAHSAMMPQIEAPNPMAPAAPSFMINNRPLIRLNGKIISLMDVVKKMDLIIYEYYPETRNSPVSLFQFYNSQWKFTFEDMVFNELILADGEAKEIKVSDGDVREEMERRFGPNIISNLSKLNLQYAEVKEMIHAELLVRQLQSMKIYSKAQLSITPEVIKREYASHLEKNPAKEEWVYQVLSVRGKDESACRSVVNYITEDLKLQHTKLSSIYTDVQQLPQILDKCVSLNLSKEFVVDGKNLSEEHKSILTKLKNNEFSAPIAQVSRVDNTNVYRIFHLKDHQVTAPPSFYEIFEKLEMSLLNQAATQEREIYKKKLYKKFGLDENVLKQIIPDDYQPFTIK